MSAHKLFSPLTLRSVTFKNRLVVSPMCQYSSEDGFYSDYHLVHLGSRALGGYGLVFTEATAVEPEGRISPEDAGLWKDDHIPALKRITEFISSHGAVPGIQLAHAGRKASAASPWNGDHHLKEEERGWETKAPSALKFDPSHLWKTPRELTPAEILEIQDKFVQATRRAVQAGFKVIEIHAAHGYLLHEFLSPHANQRTDEYGGSFENRVRFLLETVEKVRAALPEELPLFVRLNSTDWGKPEAGGWTIEDAVRATRLLKDLGVDLLDASSGFVIPNFAEIPFGPNFQVPLSERIKKEAGIPVGAVGFITGGKQAEEILEKGQADLIFQARESLRDPFFPYHAAQELGQGKAEAAQILPIQYSNWLKR